MTFTLSTIESAAINVELNTFTPVYEGDVPSHLSGTQDKTGSTYVRINNVTIKSALESNLNTRYRLKITHPEINNFGGQGFRYKKENTTLFPTANLPQTGNQIASNLQTYPISASQSLSSPNMTTYIDTASETNPDSYLYIDDPNKFLTIGVDDYSKTIVNDAIFTLVVSALSAKTPVSFTAKTDIDNITTVQGKPIFYSSDPSNIGQKIFINDEAFIIQNKNTAGSLSGDPAVNLFVFPENYKVHYKAKIEYDATISQPLAYYNDLSDFDLSGPNQDGFVADVTSQILVKGEILSLSALSTLPVPEFSSFNIFVRIPGSKATSYLEVFSEADHIFTGPEYKENGTFQPYPSFGTGGVSGTTSLNIKVIVNYVSSTDDEFKLISGSNFSSDLFTNGNDAYSFDLSFIQGLGFDVSKIGLGSSTNGVNFTRFLNTEDYSSLDTAFKAGFLGKYNGQDLTSPAITSLYDAYLVIPAGSSTDYFGDSNFNNINISMDKLSGPITNLRIINVPTTNLLFFNGSGEFVTGIYSKNSIYWLRTEADSGWVRRTFMESGTYSFEGINKTLSEILGPAIYDNYDLFNIYNPEFSTTKFFNGIDPSTREPVLIGQFKNKFNETNLTFRFLLEYYNGSSWIKVTDNDSADPNGEETITVSNPDQTDYRNIKVITTEDLSFTTPTAYTDTLGPVGENLVIKGSLYTILNKSVLPNGAVKTEVDAALASMSEPTRDAVLVLPEQNLKNVVHHVMDRTSNILMPNYEKTYNMIVTYATPDIPTQDPKLYYNNTFTFEPSIRFHGTNFSSGDLNITPANFTSTPFSSFITEYNNFAQTPQVIDLILVLPALANETKYIPVSTTTKKIAIIQSATASDFFLYHRSATSTIGGTPGGAIGTVYGSVDSARWIDFTEYPEIIIPDPKKYFLSELDNSSREFGSAEFLLVVGTDFFTLFNNYLYAGMPQVQTLNIGIINGVIPQNYLDNTAYHSTLSYGKTFGGNAISPLLGFFKRSAAPLNTDYNSEFTNFQSSGNSVDVIVFSTIIPGGIRTAPRFLKGSGEYRERDLNNGFVDPLSPSLEYFLNGAIRNGVPQNDGVSRNFLDTINETGDDIDLYYFTSDESNIGAGSTFVDDVVFIQANSGTMDAFQFFRSTPQSNEPNREGRIVAKTFRNTDLIFHTTLKWNRVRLERVGIRTKTGVIREITFDEKDSDGNYIYRNDTFSFGYIGQNELKSSCRVFLREEMGETIVAVSFNTSSLNKFAFGYIEISQEPERTIGVTNFIGRIR